MTRLARDRDTHLSEGEIAAEALRCFDETTAAPSIRQLAAVLKVTPSAIYHHYPSRAAIVQAAVNLVWAEATTNFLELIPDPFVADPTEVLVSSGLATRRAFGRHYRIAPFLAATPQAEPHMVAILALMANVFERLGLDTDAAAASFHSYASFTLGSTLFAATRRITTEAAEAETPAKVPAARFRSVRTSDSSPASNNGVHHALDEMMDISYTDPERDEELFVQGLRRLIAGFVTDPR
jgi:AcrR family transcriptional regulator